MAQTYPNKSLIQNTELILGSVAVFGVVTELLSPVAGLAVVTILTAFELFYSIIRSEPSTYLSSSYVPKFVYYATPKDSWKLIRQHADGHEITSKMALVYIVQLLRSVTVITVGLLVMWIHWRLFIYIGIGVFVGFSLLRVWNGVAYQLDSHRKPFEAGVVYSNSVESDSTALKDFISEQLSRFKLPPIELEPLPEDPDIDDYGLFVSRKRVPTLYYGSSISDSSERSLSETAKHSIMHEIGHLTSVKYIVATYALRITQALGIIGIFNIGRFSLTGSTILVWFWLLLLQLGILWVSRREEYYVDKFAAIQTDEPVENHVLSLLEQVDDEHNPFAHPDSILWTFYVLCSTHPPIESRIKNICKWNESI